MGNIVSVLGKLTGKVKYVFALLLIALVVANKCLHLGLGTDEWSWIVGIAGGVLGLDSVEGINQARMDAKVEAAVKPPTPAA